jgi:hypothetical protein
MEWEREMPRADYGATHARRKKERKKKRTRSTFFDSKVAYVQQQLHLKILYVCVCLPTTHESLFPLEKKNKIIIFRIFSSISPLLYV